MIIYEQASSFACAFAASLVKTPIEVFLEISVALYA